MRSALCGGLAALACITTGTIASAEGEGMRFSDDRYRTYQRAPALVAESRKIPADVGYRAAGARVEKARARSAVRGR